VLSNDLDEYTIQSLRDQGGCADSYGVGTRLVTAFDQPTLGGVYKLSAVRPEGKGTWQDRLKVSEQIGKMTVPGVLNIRRYYYQDGRIAGDMVFDENTGVDAREVIIDPTDDLRRKVLLGKPYDTLLHPLARSGKTVLPSEYRSAIAAKKRTQAGLVVLDESQKRMLNPHSYPVGLECGLFERRHNLVVKLRGIQ